MNRITRVNDKGVTEELISEVTPFRVAPASKPAAPAAKPPVKNANQVALETAIQNANKFRQERDTALSEVTRLKKENQRLIGEMEQQKGKKLSEASEAEINRARAMFGLR